ncbi:conserved hypothetical protein [Ricinus communis]|uniref:Uncharacterized protein n=1 Tax=Ricinus communis TaxID=3988 RepID=B9SRL7_RICCO|nr:conserved hypothetical protein [Ricinus communis]
MAIEKPHQAIMRISFPAILLPDLNYDHLIALKQSLSVPPLCFCKSIPSQQQPALIAVSSPPTSTEQHLFGVFD